MLVRDAQRAGIRVVPVPGASALITALSASGLPTDRFSFEGFLPAKGGARRKLLESLRQERRTLAFYESPHRILDSLADMAAIFGQERQAVLARELTKTFETFRHDSLGALREWVAGDANQQKGEFVLLVHGAEECGEGIDPEASRIAALLAEELSLKQAAALAAKISGGKKNMLYKFLLERQKG